MKVRIAIVLICLLVLTGCSNGQADQTSQTTEKQMDQTELLAMVEEMTKPTPENPNLAASSNLYDYINAHRDIFDELVAGGQHTVDVFTEVLKNADTFGLNENIMAAVCGEITGTGNALAAFYGDYVFSEELAVSGSEEGVSDFIALNSDFISGYDPDQCYNITPELIKANSDYLIFKYNQSSASFLLFAGEIYALGNWFGGYGVTDMKLADLNGDEKQELFFTFSAGSGLHICQAGYFDPETKQVSIIEYVDHDFYGELMLIEKKDGGLALFRAVISHMNDFVNFQLEPTEYVADLYFADGTVKLAAQTKEYD